ncbi:MAG TPA: Holliday junction branch migration protein RuvA [bacterium]|nr:Holliday junction branch migration protein RuvA [bacterium]HOL46861.1 Holliday junction branch migration protein RuvA [bacterium]HPQ18790.1 Holliday junction branch migration protein RuvA [bacterium]
MIATLNGKLIQKEINKIIIDVNGIGFEVSIPLSTFDKLPELNSELFLFIYTYITENTMALYGFKTIEEKEFFLTLLPINKIGPKTAISIMSHYNFEKFKNLILTEDVKTIAKIPGIGLKTAEKIIIELRDKITKLNINYKETLQVDSAIQNNIIQDAVAALVQLGFNYRDALIAVQKIIKVNKEITIEEIIKTALKELK